jgi:hypothetical protein
MEHALLDSAHLLDSLGNLFAVLIRPPTDGLSLRGVSNSNILGICRAALGRIS